MGNSGWGSARTRHRAALVTAGTTEEGLTTEGGLSRRCPTLEASGGWMSPHLRRTVGGRAVKSMPCFL